MKKDREKKETDFIEISFSDSVAGNHRYITKNIEQENVISLLLMLDFGLLQDGFESDERIGFGDKMYGISEADDPSQASQMSLSKKNKENMERLKDLLAKGKSVRIWIDETPNAVCGLYALCAFLLNYDNDVYVIKCPRCIKGHGEWCIAPGWGTFNDVPLDAFSDLTRKLEKEEMSVYAQEWDRLVAENSPLRTVIAGLPVSVPEEFYDRFLEEFILNKPIKIGTIISRIVEKYPLGLNTVWYEKRIYDKVEQGEYRILSRGSYFTDDVIQRV